MDTSETYIKMSHCREIQYEHILSKGDYYARYNTGKSAKLESIRLDVYLYTKGAGRSVDYYIGEHPRIPIWLPLQDQLQKMVSDNANHMIKQVGITNCLRFKDLPQMMRMSWEQLWLAFVMKELHNKVWNGESWVVEVKDSVETK